MSVSSRTLQWHSGMVAVLLAAALVRLIHLTDRSLWFDEAFSWRLSQFPFAEFLERAEKDVHPVLYYIVLRLWAAPFTFFGADLSLFWLRALSVLLGVATVAAMAMAGTVLFRSRFVGAAAALFTAFNAFQVQYAWEARMYTLGTLLLPLAFITVLRCAQAVTWPQALRRATAAGMVSGALLHVHYYTLFSVAALGSFAAVVVIVRLYRAWRRAWLLPSTWALILGMVLAGMIFAPWAPIFLAQRAQVQQVFWIPPLAAWSVPNTMARLFMGGVSEPLRATAVVSVLAVVLVLGSALARGRTRSDILLVLSFLLPFAGSWWISRSTSIYQDRYFVFASLPLLLLCARVASFLPRRAAITAVVALSLGAFATITNFWRQLDFPSHPGAAGAAAFLLQETKAEEPVIVSSSFTYFPMAFHLPGGVSALKRARRPARAVSPRLYSEKGELLHFSGGPILLRADLVGPEVFRQERLQRLWAVDTTGFGGSTLSVLLPFTAVRKVVFPELFAYQGDIIVREYISAP